MINTIKLKQLVAAASLMTFAAIVLAVSVDKSNAFSVVAVAHNIHMLKGRGGNVAVLVGEEGALIVDDNFEKVSADLDARIRELGGDQLKFVLNTHWHGDHTGGNIVFGKRANIIAHTNVRKRLKTRQEVKEFKMIQEPQKTAALPVITYEDSLSVHFNGEEISAVHLPNGHTDSDSVIYFKNANVVHMGDLYFQGMLPFIDLNSGGSVRHYADNVGAVIKRIDSKTKVIPGHGQLSNLSELKAYHMMLQDSIKVINNMKKQGLSLEQAQAKGLPPSLEKWATGFIKSDRWIKTLYEGS